MISNRDYENIGRWGLPPLQTFPMNPKAYPDEFSIYQNHKNKLLQLCKSHLQGNWSLSCCLWGHFKDIAKPSIIVFYREKLPSWVDPTIDGLQFISIESPIELHSTLPVYQTLVHSSACIGTQNKIGTFGGYVQDINKKTIYGLTCAHVQTHEGGFSEVHQPSPAAINSSLNDMEVLEEDKNSLRQIEDTHFGKIVDGEVDYMENENSCRFDWVLFSPNENRIGSNFIPKSKDNTQLFEKIEVSFCEVDEKVWKTGHTTKFSTGTVHGIEAYISVDGIFSKEWVVIGSPFSLPGDSGAWIVNKGGVCGVVMAGCEGKSWTYFTKFNDLLKRIYVKTGLQLEPVSKMQI